MALSHLRSACWRVPWQAREQCDARETALRAEMGEARAEAQRGALRVQAAEAEAAMERERAASVVGKLAEAEAAARAARAQAEEASALARQHQSQAGEMAVGAAQRELLEGAVQALTEAHRAEASARHKAESSLSALEGASKNAADASAIAIEGANAKAEAAAAKLGAAEERCAGLEAAASEAARAEDARRRELESALAAAVTQAARAEAEAQRQTELAAGTSAKLEGAVGARHAAEALAAEAQGRVADAQAAATAAANVYGARAGGAAVTEGQVASLTADLRKLRDELQTAEAERASAQEESRRAAARASREGRLALEAETTIAEQRAEIHRLAKAGGVPSSLPLDATGSGGLTHSPARMVGTSLGAGDAKEWDTPAAARVRPPRVPAEGEGEEAEGAREAVDKDREEEGGEEEEGEVGVEHAAEGAADVVSAWAGGEGRRRLAARGKKGAPKGGAVGTRRSVGTSLADAISAKEGHCSPAMAEVKKTPKSGNGGVANKASTPRELFPSAASAPIAEEAPEAPRPRCAGLSTSAPGTPSGAARLQALLEAREAEVTSYRVAAEERQHLWASARQGMADDWEAERAALVGEVESLRAKTREHDGHGKKHAETAAALKAKSTDLERLNVELTNLAADLREEGAKRAAAESKRRAAEQAAIGLKQQIKEAEADGAAAQEKLAKLRATVEQQGKQLRAIRLREQKETSAAENAPPTNSVATPSHGASGASRTRPRDGTGKMTAPARIKTRSHPQPHPAALIADSHERSESWSPGSSAEHTDDASPPARGSRSSRTVHTNTVAAAAAAAAAMAAGPGGGGAMAEEVRTLRQTVGELEAYTIELEGQIGALERQLDAANAELHAYAGTMHQRASDDHKRAVTLEAELSRGQRELDELHDRASSLDAANESLTVANAGLSEQVRKLRAERQRPLGGRTLQAIAEGGASSSSPDPPLAVPPLAASAPAPAPSAAGSDAAPGSDAMSMPRTVLPSMSTPIALALAVPHATPKSAPRTRLHAAAALAAGAPTLEPEATPAARAAAIAPASVAAAAAAAASEAELEKRLSELDEIGRTDYFSDELALLRAAAPGHAPRPAQLPSDASVSAPSETSLPTEASLPPPPAVAIVASEGSYARGALQTSSTLASTKLNELSRITDAIRTGRPLHALVTSPDNPTGAGVGVSAELAALLHKPASQRVAERHAQRSLREGAPSARAGVGGSHVADTRAYTLKAAEAAVKELRMQFHDASADEDDEDEADDDDDEDVPARAVQFDMDDDDESDDDDNDNDDDEEEEEEDDEAQEEGASEESEASEEEAAEGGAVPAPTRVVPKVAKGKSVRSKVAGKAASAAASRTTRGITRLTGSSSSARGAGAGDARIAAAVARSKPSRLRRLLDQEVACQQAVAASLAGA